MTVEKAGKLKQEYENIQKKIDLHKTITPKDLWETDLNHFSKAYKKYLKDYPLDY